MPMGSATHAPKPPSDSYRRGQLYRPTAAKQVGVDRPLVDAAKSL